MAVSSQSRPIEGLGFWIAAQFAGIGVKPGELERPILGEPRDPFET